MSLVPRPQAIRLAMIGSTPGNGHPYSWSAMFNGYNRELMTKECPFAGIPVSVASATCYTQDLNVAVGGTRGRDGGQAFNLVHVYEHTIVHSVALLGATPAVGELVSPAEAQRRLAAAGISIPEKAKLEAPARTAARPKFTTLN